jgi:hypothetical protein
MSKDTSPSATSALSSNTTTPQTAKPTKPSNANAARTENNSLKHRHSYTAIPARIPLSMENVNFRWNHFENDGLSKIEDLLLRQEMGGECVSAVFQYISH